MEGRGAAAEAATRFPAPLEPAGVPALEPAASLAVAFVLLVVCRAPCNRAATASVKSAEICTAVTAARLERLALARTSTLSISSACKEGDHLRG